MAGILGWSEDQRTREVESVRKRFQSDRMTVIPSP
jgi:hypothetical protein